MHDREGQARKPGWFSGPTTYENVQSFRTTSVSLVIDPVSKQTVFGQLEARFMKEVDVPKIDQGAHERVFKILAAVQRVPCLL